jgi:rhamnogalacturonan endolyase
MPRSRRQKALGTRPSLAAERLEPRQFLAGDLIPALEVVLPEPGGFADVFQRSVARQVEYLTRGVNVSYLGGGQAYVDWRLLGTDPGSIAFNLYRVSGIGAAVKRNATPLTTVTNFTDTGLTTSQPTTYFVKPVINGVEGEASESFTLPANPPTRQYRSVPLQIPAGGVTPAGDFYTYSANDTSVADLDGDGVYELIVKWDPSNAKDNSQSGYTGNVYLDAYELDGTRLWRIDLGRNIRAGAHYTQFIVYDFDGDGRAEMAVKTAPGTIDGAGKPVLLGAAKVTDDYRSSSGYILSGPEYLTIFDGLTGSNLVTAPYTPPRGTVSSWGDSYGNRVDRFLAGVAYLDGQRPSLLMARGYYTRTVVAAYDFRDGRLTERWIFDTGTSSSDPLAAYKGQGAHSLTVGDVDGDGRDEVVYGAMTIDDDGSGLYTTRLGHGDALHLSDMVPSRPGLEVFQVHESEAAHKGMGGTLRDAATGEVIAFVPGTGDIGRGVAFDIDPRYPGYELLTSSGGVYAADGTQIQASSNAFLNFGIWWDGDPLRELLDGTTIADWRIGSSGTGGRVNLVFAPPGVSSNNGTKQTPALLADLYGDWREEVIWRASDSSELQIWSTTIASSMRLPTLMHDTQYRAAVAWQNVGYNQPPHPSYFIGHDMAMPGQPNVYVATANQPPTLTSVSALAPTVAGTSVVLTATATDDGGESALTYTWAMTSGPAGVAFAINGSNLAKQTTAVFSAMGSYLLTVTATDAEGRSVSRDVSIAVVQTPSGLEIPVVPVLTAADGRQRIPAWVVDQFGDPLASQAGVAWSLVAGSGSIDANGVYAAGSTAGFAVVRFAYGSEAHEIPVTIVAAGVDRLPVQAESGTFGGGVVLESTHAGSSGAGYLNFPATGGFLQLAGLDGGVGGAQAVLVRYALGAAAARTGGVTINGVTSAVTFEPTGAWTSWNTLAIPAVLTAGTTNTIRFESTGQDLGNLDLVWPATPPVAASPSEVVTVAAGQTMVDSQARSSTLPLIKDGAGTLVLTAAATMTGGVTMAEGTLVVQASTALGQRGLTVTGGEVRFELGYGIVSLDSLAITGGRLDLGTGQLRVAAGGYDLAVVRQWLLAGRNGGGWDGGIGIMSRSAGPAVLREVGYAVSEGVLTIGWAAPGDANLDGVVNVFDLASVLARGAYGGSGGGAAWADGDFNYDGRVSLLDLVQISSSSLMNAPGYRTGTGTGPETGLGSPGTPANSGTLAAFALMAADAASGADESEEPRLRENLAQRHQRRSGLRDRISQPLARVRQGMDNQPGHHLGRIALLPPGPQ